MIDRVGILYNVADDQTFLFDDLDYYYKTKTVKLQFFIPVIEKKNWGFTFIGQPQIQLAEHQLQNIQFVTPDDDNYLENRIRFSEKRNMTLIAFEIGSMVYLKLLKDLSLEANIGLGVANIDTESERLAKGFTFIENGSLGLSYKINKSAIYLGGNIGHVSNFEIKQPNSGYNIMGIEIGYRFYIN